MNFIWCWTHLSYTYVQILSYVQMLLWCCFAAPNPSQSCERNVVMHSTSNLWLWYVLQSILVGPINNLKPICVIDRPMLWKHCYHFVCFPVGIWSPSVTCLDLHKDICGLCCSALSSHLKLKLHFMSDQFPLNARYLFTVHANVSNLSQINVRFVTDIWYV